MQLYQNTEEEEAYKGLLHCALLFPFFFYFVTKGSETHCRQLNQQLRTKGSTFLCPLMLDKKHISATVMPSFSSSFSGYSAKSALSTRS